MKGVNVMFLFPILFAVVIYFLVVDKRTYHRFSSKEDLPLEQLKNRFVKGEIDEETYMKMKQIISD